MKVSVVIPNYNGIRYLGACIDSLWRQTYTNFEVIIIDNASQDNTYEWLENDERIIFKRLDKNYGFSKAVNEGICLAKGEYVILLNNDTVIEEDFIERLVLTVESTPEIFGISSKMIDYFNRDIVDDAGDEYTLLGYTHKIGMGDFIDNYIEPYQVFSACAGASLYRKQVFEEIGYFDEQFFAYMEDVDISYRARIYGYENVYCPEAKVYHIGSATSGSKYNAFKVKLAARNNIYVPYKNMPLLQLIINSPFLALGIVIKMLFFLQRGFGKEYVEGLKEGFATLHSIEKVPFKVKHIKNYIVIEWLLIKNTFKYLLIKIKKKIK